MPTYQTAKKAPAKRRAVKPSAPKISEPAAEAAVAAPAPAVESPAPQAPVDPYAPVAAPEPVSEPATVKVRTVHPYRLYIHTQDRVLPPKTPTVVQNDAWVRGQIKMGILEIV